MPYWRATSVLGVWLPGTAVGFYLPFVALRCCGLQAFYPSHHTSKCTLPAVKLTLTCTNSTQTLFLHVCSPHPHTQTRINSQLLKWLKVIQTQVTMQPALRLD
ncbi:hypothetical protein ILYODFUR_024311 [Ilyodon furcidens]|uniref:Secreted protein n=1 Tax=Ilyodon furcidens TaxID=33524 RepID=A0ABV0TMW2_9TELE